MKTYSLVLRSPALFELAKKRGIENWYYRGLRRLADLSHFYPQLFRPCGGPNTAAGRNVGINMNFLGPIDSGLAGGIARHWRTNPCKAFDKISRVPSWRSLGVLSPPHSRPVIKRLVPSRSQTGPRAIYCSSWILVLRDRLPQDPLGWCYLVASRCGPRACYAVPSFPVPMRRLPRGLSPSRCPTWPITGGTGSSASRCGATPPLPSSVDTELQRA
jgi:hypothetical protein